jgi:hypothetical protein
MVVVGVVGRWSLAVSLAVAVYAVITGCAAASIVALAHFVVDLPLSWSVIMALGVAPWIEPACLVVGALAAASLLALGDLVMDARPREAPRNISSVLVFSDDGDGDANSERTKGAVGDDLVKVV